MVVNYFALTNQMGRNNTARKLSTGRQHTADNVTLATSPFCDVSGYRKSALSGPGGGGIG
ncbi:hypothetical protein KCP69_09500 [Salmonella enterica subsp. enterica]|nr:hypothetical protein KCP69_09500 [Salmonella enterica subsp. enterica]